MKLHPFIDNRRLTIWMYPHVFLCSVTIDVWFPLARKLMTLRIRTILINHTFILVTKIHEVINSNNECTIFLDEQNSFKETIEQIKTYL